MHRDFHPSRLAACLHINAKWPDAFAHLKDHQETNGPWCWIPLDMRPLASPVYCRGAQGIWSPSPEIVQAVTHMLKETA